MSNKKNLNFVFFGTPDVASETLEILKNKGYMPSLIVTATDKPQGRKMILTPPPVKTWAIENNIPYIQPEKINDKFLEEINGIIDFFLVVAYGKIMPENLIKLPRMGSINIHYSLLPKYRGASPVESAILSGDTETGISIQQMEYKMDAGPILAEKKVAIFPDETTEELRSRLVKIGGELLIKILPSFSAEVGLPQIVQDESKATFCKKIKKEDGLVNLEKESPDALYNKYRAYHKWPRIYFFQDNKRIIITEATLENSPLGLDQDKKFKILKVIPEGKKEVSWEEYSKKQN